MERGVAPQQTERRREEVKGRWQENGFMEEEVGDAGHEEVGDAEQEEVGDAEEGENAKENEDSGKEKVTTEEIGVG
ncbi:hypothetical protein NDU88_010787 [Pleurodeles waltl]|uniref:Uncharacterized protein n=1 Tax=Pleurodeles waltl TaxID=8319 RepID=A0AAV7QXC2_PLEWA|nr:hypothetical protein NDU88_010787 [Pleurodeles waltl]